MLKDVDINELQPGMYVQSIAKQKKSNFKITSAGRVKSFEAIRALKQKGILTVVVDFSKALQVNKPSASPQEQDDQQTIKPQTTEQQSEKSEDFEPQFHDVSFEQEIVRAQQIYRHGKALLTQLVRDVSRDKDIDFREYMDFTNKLIGSLKRNPNALLCLTKMRDKNKYLLEHSLNVAVLLANFGHFLNFNKSEIEELAFAGFTHDIGKVKIPTEIIDKPGKLSELETSVMQTHVSLTTDILQKGDVSQGVLRTIGENQERLDGSGYPMGKRADQISRMGRMIAIVDSFDAMTANRCYRKARTSKQALRILLNDADNKYDKQLVQKFIQCIGVYPVGSLVQLSNSKLAMVLEQNKKSALIPTVTTFYSVRNNHYLPPQQLDLEVYKRKCVIEKSVLAEDFGLDFQRLFNESIAG